MEFEARDKDMMNHWRMITGQVHCSICKKILPENSSYGHGRHAMVDFRTRQLSIICDYCYVGLQHNITPEEMQRRNYIETELQNARDNLYKESIEYRRISKEQRDFHHPRQNDYDPSARPKVGLDDLVESIVDHVIDHAADAVKSKAKSLGKTLWEDLSN